MHSGWDEPVLVDLIELAVLYNMKPKVLLIADLIRVLAVIEDSCALRLKNQRWKKVHISTHCLSERCVVPYVSVLFKLLANLPYDLMIEDRVKQLTAGLEKIIRFMP